MIVRLPLIINSVDFSMEARRLGYSIEFEDRTGNNTRTMLNGDEFLDVIAQKPVITWQLDSLTGGRLAALHAAINAATYVPVQYWDTRINALETALFHGTISSQSIGVLRADGSRWRGPVLTLRAR